MNFYWFEITPPARKRQRETRMATAAANSCYGAVPQTGNDYNSSLLAYSILSVLDGQSAQLRRRQLDGGHVI